MEATPHTPILMYSTAWCPDCHRAKRFLSDHGFLYEEVDIDHNPEAAELVMANNDGRRRVPTLVINEQYYGNPPLRELSRVLGV